MSCGHLNLDHSLMMLIVALLRPLERFFSWRSGPLPGSTSDWFFWALTLSRATFSIWSERLMVFIFCLTGVH